MRMRLMKILIEIVLLSMLYELSVIISDLLPMPIPPVLIGMGLLILLLKTKLIQTNHLENASNFFTRHMLFFFIPIIAGVMHYWNIIRQGGWDLLFTVVISTASVLITTAYVTLLFRKRRKAR